MIKNFLNKAKLGFVLNIRIRDYNNVTIVATAETWKTIIREITYICISFNFLLTFE